MINDDDNYNDNENNKRVGLEFVRGVFFSVCLFVCLLAAPMSFGARKLYFNTKIFF